MGTFVVAMTGASGAPYARRLVELLLDGGNYVHLLASPSAELVLKEELGADLAEFVKSFGVRENLSLEPADRMNSPLASGSYPTDGMVVCPCSVGTLGHIASGACANIIHRAAEVHLKERRKLILVVRETPLSLIAIENMERAARAGAVILPPSPGFYNKPSSIGELVDFVVARILDQLGVATSVGKRYKESEWRAS